MAQMERERTTPDLLDLRARMAAWDRSFVAGHGRHPDAREWAGAARTIGRLPFEEAEALAAATYAAYGPAAPSAPARPEFEDFAQRVIARQARRRQAAQRREEPTLAEWPVVARPRERAEPPALVRAAAPIVLAGLALACWVASGRTEREAA
jgi:hypothetical protein